jgi:hypothetical protein
MTWSPAPIPLAGKRQRSSGENRRNSQCTYEAHSERVCPLHCGRYSGSEYPPLGASERCKAATGNCLRNAGAASIIARISSLPRPLPTMPNIPFWLAKQNYARLRQIAYTRIRDEAVQTNFVRAPVLIADTDEHTIHTWQTSWTGPHPTNQGSWNWDYLLRRAWRRPSAFHVAIWSGDHLCGLAVGRASKRRAIGARHTISVHFIESAHNDRHPLRGRVAALVIAAAEAYGSLIGASRLRLINPLPGVIRLYEDYGFAVARKAGQPVYCERRILP